jgi:hypothetical protein
MPDGWYVLLTVGLFAILAFMVTAAERLCPPRTSSAWPGRRLERSFS